jgi:3-oxoadipate enol-lactonase
MPILERPNAKINYEIWGEGDVPTITLLNGFTRTLKDLRAMGRFFVEHGWRVVALDNRGAGQTEITGGFTLQESADDVLAVWDVLGIKQSHVLGISYGGLLSMVLGLRAPTRVKSLTLVSTTAQWNNLKIKTDSGSSQRWDPDDSFLRYFSPSFVEGHKILVRSLSKEMAKAFQDPILMQGAQAQRAAMNGFDLSGQLAQLKMPVIIIHGSDDKVVDVGVAGDLASQIPHAKFEVFEECGHLLLAENPRRLYDAALGFVKENE